MPLTTVYAPASGVVNGNNCSPQPLRAACDAAGIPCTELADLAFGRMLRCSLGGATVSVGKVLHVLLQHANTGHDRVFPCIQTIAEESSLSETTVKVALAWLQRVGAVRRIDDPDELHEGDGPHRATERGIKRRGHHQVNTYEISGLLRWLPSWVLDRLFPVPGAQPEHGAAVSAAMAADFPQSDPFEIPQDSSAPSAPAVSVEALSVLDMQRAETARKTRAAAAGGRGFLGRKIGPIRQVRSPVVSQLITAGVWPSRAVSMERRKGALWCRALLHYAAEEKPANPGGWLWAASRNEAWEWPERIERWIERERASAARVVTAEAICGSGPRPEVAATSAQSVAELAARRRGKLGALLEKIAARQKNVEADCKKGEGSPSNG